MAHHKRKSLADAFPQLNLHDDIGEDDVAVTSPAIQGGDGKSYGSSPFDLIGNLHSTVSKKFASSTSKLDQSVPAPMNFTVRMNGAYLIMSGSDDPEILFETTEAFREEMLQALDNIHAANQNNIKEHMASTLARLVFGSNLIEHAGSNFDITLRICRKIFEGKSVAENISEREPEYEELRKALIENNMPANRDAVFRSRREIVQHCRALNYIVKQTVIDNNPLTEDIIKRCHKILTYKVDAPDGTSWREYGGSYRHDSVVAGFSTFTPTDLVPLEMEDMINTYNMDVKKINTEDEVDPYDLAAKYCHIFVNIHPFQDGNGRVCRMILNSILLKYAGVVAVIGENEEERDEYLATAGRASQNQQEWKQADEEEREFMAKPWTELAVLTLRGVMKGAKGFCHAVLGRDVSEDEPEDDV
ncbi:Hypothetical protein D9617_18g033600 [Elsinoe fawcettii]|nr:Hypothetical protein D9617_18g033600 [Elsinoe fawcettii]